MTIERQIRRTLSNPFKHLETKYWWTLRGKTRHYGNISKILVADDYVSSVAMACSLTSVEQSLSGPVVTKQPEPGVTTLPHLRLLEHLQRESEPQNTDIFYLMCKGGLNMEAPTDLKASSLAPGENYNTKHS